MWQENKLMVSEYFSKLKTQFSTLSRINKYTIAASAFVLWLAIFDSHSFATQYKLSKTVNKLEAEKASYAEKLDIAIKDKLELENNKAKFAREKFLFHKDNEEIIVIQNQDNQD